jgi:hypothetical protein
MDKPESYIKLESYTKVLRDNNFPVAIKYEPEKGRYLITSRDVKKGEFLFSDKPYCSVIPDNHHEDTCHNCYKLVKGCTLEFKCERCHYPHYCSLACKTADTEHLPMECKALTKFNELTTNYDKDTKIMARLVLRFIIKAHHDKAQHNDDNSIKIRYMDIEQTVSNRELFSENIIKKFSETAHTISKCLSDDANKFDIEYIIDMMYRAESASLCFWNTNDDYYASCFCAIASLLNHSCYPSVIKYCESGDQGHYVYALHDMKAGDELLYCYCCLSDNLAARRNDLSPYHFTCCCERCKADEKGNGAAFNTFLEETVCKNKECKATIINLPEGMNIRGKTGRICSVCGVNTPAK